MQKKTILLGLFCFVMSISVNAQDLHKFHSIFIYNFSKFIQWPPQYKEGDFVIGVLGDSPITDHLNTMAASKRVGAQKFTIKTFSNPSEITKCHILYIPSNKSDVLGECISAVGKNATLVVTDKPGLAKNGSCINFLIDNGKPKFELNRAISEKYNLKVSTELTKLAILI